MDVCHCWAGRARGFKLRVGYTGARPLLMFTALLVCKVGGVSSLCLLYQRGLVLGVVPGTAWVVLGCAAT
eukprot:633021-Rhodomonas_salina.1